MATETEAVTSTTMRLVPFYDGWLVVCRYCGRSDAEVAKSGHLFKGYANGKRTGCEVGGFPEWTLPPEHNRQPNGRRA